MAGVARGASGRERPAAWSGKKRYGGSEPAPAAQRAGSGAGGGLAGAIDRRRAIRSKLGRARNMHIFGIRSRSCAECDDGSARMRLRRSTHKEFLSRPRSAGASIAGSAIGESGIQCADGSGQRRGLHLHRGASALPGQQPPVVAYNHVDAPYFDTMRIPLLRGRAFRENDDEKAPLVAIVNQTMAQQFWPNEDPIGKRFSLKSATGPFAEIVGVTGDGKYVFIGWDKEPYFYVPLAQNFTSYGSLQIALFGAARNADHASAERGPRVDPTAVRRSDDEGSPSRGGMDFSSSRLVRFWLRPWGF